MATTTTPNMGMILPVPSSEAGPAWASELITALTNILDTHDHSSGKGVRIGPSGIGINADFSFSSHAITDLTKAQFTSQTGAMSGTNFIYVLNGDWYVLDGNGASIRLTSSGAINVSSAGGFGGDYVSAGAIASFTNATKYYSFKDGSSVKGILDSKGQQNDGKLIWATTAVSSSPYTIAADDAILLIDTSTARQINLPDPTSAKRYVVLVDSTGSNNTNNTTIHRFGSEKIQNVAADFVWTTNYGSLVLVSNLTDWFILNQSYADRTSVTVFEGSRTAGTDTLTGAVAATWVSPTLAAATLTEGTAVTRSTNNLTFPFVGKYSLEVFPSVLSGGGGAGTGQNFVRLRNTTDSTTADQIIMISNGCSRLDFTVSDISKTYQVQMNRDNATGDLTLTTTAPTQGDGATSPRWKLVFTKLKDS